ncbi:diacylglycerol O-acyltransferase 2A [Rhizodiscina lignyota]|uniref:Diacylglycerol O-acyltransferase n=1 Tax=Rhizodiscina lignyota TaxID=1504668 RepID=A0A9P4IGC2_9PEZI|nr:diacylglycerol O-acyltransferase 2A [Rhizodiscina lignyota]
MASTAALNAEPSRPDDRAEQHLPPKSYSDAAQQPPPTTSSPQTNGIHRIDPPTPGEYSGSGMGEAPQSPSRGHKRVSSKPSNPKLNGSAKKEQEGDNGSIVQERYRSINGSGETLNSVKPSNEYDERLWQDRKERKKKQPELVTGRRAGAGWERSKIRWAPFNVPLQRRLQTAMVLLHTLSIALFLTFFFWLCAIPLLWPIILLYLLYILISRAPIDGRLSLRTEAMRRSKLWSLFASYFPARLYRLGDELPPTRKYIFGYHPHGIISHGAFAAFATEALGFGQLFPGITNTLLTLDSNFRIPLYRDYALRLGLASVSRESCENILSKGGPNNEGMGRAITIVIGGARESLDASPGVLKLVLGRRKGFVKLAIRTGADLVPVLAFGENDLYEQVSAVDHPWIHKFQLLVKKFMGFTVPLFHARGVFNYDVGLMPYRRPINIVVGKPIMVQMQEKPDPAYVDQVHAQYMSELKDIWDDFKDRFAKDREGELEIIE